MTQKNNESSKKPYRIVHPEGKITWSIEELWEGGIIRGPYGSKHAAIKAEEIVAQEDGFIHDLALQEVVGEEIMPTDAFEKDADGNWHCLKACTINVEGKSIIITAGMTFETGSLFLGADIGKWLTENYASQQRT